MPPAARTLAARPCTEAAVLLAAALSLAACADSPRASGGAGATPDQAAGGGISGAEDDLVVEYDAGDGSPPESWSLTCAGSAGGTHPDAEAACAHLAGLDDPFAALPADVVCTEQYGGPQTARVAGVWGGDPVDVELTRVDGCRISQWDALVPLLPAN